MGTNITKLVEEILLKAQETQEEFIFQTIRPYCENVLQMNVNKEELKQILLNGFQVKTVLSNIESLILELQATADRTKEHMEASKQETVPSWSEIDYEKGCIDTYKYVINKLKEIIK